MTPIVGRKSSSGRRVRPRTPMNSTSTTRPTPHPQNPGSGTDSAVRTTPPAPIIGGHQRSFLGGRLVAGGFVKADNGLLRPGETASENHALVNFCENTPAGDPCGLRIADNHGGTNNGAHPRIVRIDNAPQSPEKPPGESKPAVDSFKSSTGTGWLIPVVDAVDSGGLTEDAGGGSHLCPSARLSYNGRD